MANKDILYEWWVSSEGLNNKSPITIEELVSILSSARETKKIPGLKDSLTDSGWNYAILRFLIVFCSPQAGIKSSFWADLIKNNNSYGNYGVWKKYLNEKVDINIEGMKYWKVAPGEDARFFDRCVMDQNIATGWDLLGDLKDFLNDFENFKKYYLERYTEPNNPKKIHSLNQLWDFINIKVGDIIVANKGIGKIAGLGKVTSGYIYMDDYDDYKHTLGVNWFEATTKDVPPEAKDITKGWFGVTVKELTKEEYDAINNPPNVLENSLKIKDINNSEKITLLLKKKQIILYGPPGTGKTYNTKNIAMELLKSKGN